MQENRESAVDRRSFVKTAAVVAGAAAMAPLSVARSANVRGSDTLKVGLVGCGGRGTGAASQALEADKGTVLWAMGDVFKDRLESSKKNLSEVLGDRAKEKIDVSAERQFTGFDNYKAVIDSGVDVVILTSYPNFRPAHIAYALEKGKHIFAEKPIAVDMAGIRSVLASGELAKQKNLALQIGFCWRYHPALREIFAQILGGTIGDVTSVYTTYLSGILGKNPRKPEWSELEFQMRNWWHFNWISGDHIVEQAIHSVDRLSWAMGDRLPKSVICLGGRSAREGEESGNVFDHFSAVYEYEGGLKAYHNCRQIPNCPPDNTDYVYGTKGRAVVNGWNPKSLKTYGYDGKETWGYKGDGGLDMYQVEHNELFASIRAGKPINDCPRAVNSCMMGVMARMAAYTGQTVTWEQAMKSADNLQPATIGWDVTPPAPIIAVPGKTKLV
jgi:predicted dehydrogenase